MIRTSSLVCISLCAAALVGAFAASSQWLLALLSLAIGLAWFQAEWRGRGQLASPGMASVSILAGVAVLYDLTPYLMALVSVLALSAWDLSRFRQRLIGSPPGKTRQSLEGMHIRRLLLVSAGGLILTALAMGLPLDIGFYPLILLGIVLLLVLYSVVRQLASPDSE